MAVTLALPDAAIEEEGYTLERSTDGQNWIAVAELSANTLRYVDYGLARHTRYWYRLTAHNSQGSDSPQTVQAETAAEPVNIGEAWVEGEVVQTAIHYRYDELYRLTQANYSDVEWNWWDVYSRGHPIEFRSKLCKVDKICVLDK